jgi:peptidoglycan LD-endopeptidase LytH
LTQDQFIKTIGHYKNNLHSVVHFDPLKDKLLALDFSGGPESPAPELLEDTKTFSAFITDQLKNAGAKFGIGGYGEHRTIYSLSKVFDPPVSGEEPRRLHLGTDIWGKPLTPVMAPLSGLVHSFKFNDRFGDYGATIILSHNLDGLSFYTLYGHLSLSSITNLQEGDRIDGGDIIAEFGIPAENGQWPPHLHFQAILNIGDWKGDYPGVCKFSEKDLYLKNSPDPDLILKLNQWL